MSELDEALARLEAALARFEDKASAGPPPSDDGQVKGLAEALVVRIDAALARLDLLLAQDR